MAYTFYVYKKRLITVFIASSTSPSYVDILFLHVVMSLEHDSIVQSTQKCLFRSSDIRQIVLRSKLIFYVFNVQPDIYLTQFEAIS